MFHVLLSFSLHHQYFQPENGLKLLEAKLKKPQTTKIIRKTASAVKTVNWV